MSNELEARRAEIAERATATRNRAEQAEQQCRINASGLVGMDRDAWLDAARVYKDCIKTVDAQTAELSRLTAENLTLRNAGVTLSEGADRLTAALAEQAERFAEREAIYKNQIEGGSQRIAEASEREELQCQEITNLRNDLDAREEMKLVEFAEDMIQDAFDGHDVEGSDIQERAVACGLIVETTYSYERHGESEVDAEDGDPWYEFSPAFKAAIHDGALAARPTPADSGEG